jgi:C4-type Zn-finger protein
MSVISDIICKCDYSNSNVVHIRRYLPVKRVVLFEGDTDRNRVVTKSVTTVSMPH